MKHKEVSIIIGAREILCKFIEQIIIKQNGLVIFFFNDIMRLDRKIARGSIVFFVLYIIAALPGGVLWAMAIYIDETLQGHGFGYWIVLPVIMSFIVNCLYIPLFYSKRKNELSENSGILIALVDILTLYLFLIGSVAIGSILSLLYYIVYYSDNVHYFYFVFGLYYSYFVLFLFRYRFRQYKLLF